MKNVFSSLLFLFFSNFVFGQIEWVGNHEFSESASDIFRTSKNQLVLLHGNGSGFTVFNPDGSVVLDDTTFIFTSSGLSEMIESKEDSSFIFVLGGEDCDILINFLVKYDKNWNKVWSNYTGGIGGPIAGFSDNSFAIGYNLWDSMVAKWSSNGDLSWVINLDPYEIKDLAVAYNDTLYVATSQGLLKITLDGMVTDTFANLIFDRIEILPNGNFLAQTNDILYLYSPDFTQMAFFQQQGETIEDLSFDQSQIVVLTAASKIIRLDFDLNTIGSNQLTGHNQSFKALSLTDNGFVVGGGELYGNNEHKNTAAFIKSYGWDGATISTNEDIELTSVSQNGQIGVVDYFGIYEITIPNITVTVKNQGTQVVNELTANIEFPSLNAFIECDYPQVFS